MEELPRFTLPGSLPQDVFTKQVRKNLAVNGVLTGALDVELDIDDKHVALSRMDFGLTSSLASCLLS